MNCLLALIKDINFWFYKHVFIIIFLVTFSPISTAKATNEVTFSGGEPLNNYQPSVVVPILQEAFRRNGIRFSAKYYPSLRSLQLSNAGLMDGELHRVSDFHKVSAGQYPNLIKINSKLLSGWLAAFATKNIIIEDWKDLKEYKIAYYRGRKDVELFLNNILPLKYTNSVTTDQQAFRMLINGRVDIVITESRQGAKIIASNPVFAGVSEISKLKESQIFSYMHKKHKTLIKKIAETIEEMKRDGSFSNIVNEVHNNFK